MKVRVQTAEDDCFFCPDLHVTFSTTDTEELFNSQPKLIIEELSDTIERYQLETLPLHLLLAAVNIGPRPLSSLREAVGAL